MTPSHTTRSEPALTGRALARTVLDRSALVRLGAGWTGVAALALPFSFFSFLLSSFIVDRI